MTNTTKQLLERFACVGAMFDEGNELFRENEVVIGGDAGTAVISYDNKGKVIVRYEYYRRDGICYVANVIYDTEEEAINALKHFDVDSEGYGSVDCKFLSDIKLDYC